MSTHTRLKDRSISMSAMTSMSAWRSMTGWPAMVRVTLTRRLPRATALNTPTGRALSKCVATVSWKLVAAPSSMRVVSPSKRHQVADHADRDHRGEGIAAAEALVAAFAHGATCSVTTDVPRGAVAVVETRVAVAGDELARGEAQRGDEQRRTPHARKGSTMRASRVGAARFFQASRVVSLAM